MKINNKIAKKRKEDFPIFRHNLGLVYLDNAATSQRPASVINAVKDFSEKDNANVGRGVYSLAERAMKKYNQARIIVADFIKAEPEEIIFTRNATESLNLLAYTLPSILPRNKNEILITEMEHHSNLVPWQQLAKRNNMKLKFVKITKDFMLDMNDFNSKLSDKTAIVSVAQVSNVLGTINDVKLITKLAKQKGAITIIDAAQSIQHLNINVKELECDFLAFSGHKVLGPSGIGVLFGRKELLEKLPPFNFGGGMISKITKENSEWANPPEKFEAGTQNIAEAIGLAESLSYLKKISLENIKEWENYLLKYALKRLKEVPDIKIYNPGEEKSVSLVSFNLLGIHPHDIAGLLNEKRIAIRAGHCCAMPLMEILKAKGGVCRASFSFYNTLEDIDILVDALKEIQKKFA
ncbi:MAG: SufS family cysteine desulfurase [Candidatus Pacearchaeota archaeon]|nr:SufS family cysteine desulfurase [Candidatus Pacearchaeota archaeon]